MYGVPMPVRDLRNVPLEDARNYCLINQKCEKDINISSPSLLLFSTTNGFTKTAYQNREFKMSELSLRQTCEKFTIPFVFWRRNPDDLKDAMLNHWKKYYKTPRGYVKNLLLRCWHNTNIETEEDLTVRGVLSSYYKPVSNMTIIDSIKKMSNAPSSFSTFLLTNELFSATIMNYEGELSNNEYSLHLNVLNSDLGTSSLRVAYRVTWGKLNFFIPPAIEKHLQKTNTTSIRIPHINANQGYIRQVIDCLSDTEQHGIVRTSLENIVQKIISTPITKEYELDDIKEKFGKKVIESLNVSLPINPLELMENIYVKKFNSNYTEQINLMDDVGLYLFKLIK